jgi:DNA repair protein RecN (Recombination protein N)
MLAELNIKNFAIIDELKIDFDRGFNVISGETGAGKSIIIGAVNLLLGDRASADIIRSSEDSAAVEALFDISQNDPLKEKLKRLDFYQGDDLIIKRIVSRSGKNRIYINGNLTTLGTLSDIAESLVNICSQHEHQILLNTDSHIDILDEFAGILPFRAEYTVIYNQFHALNTKLRELQSIQQKKQEREDLLKFQLKEIEDADIKSGEDVNLLEEKKALSNINKLMDHAAAAYNVLYGKQVSLLEELLGVITNLQEIKNIDPSFTLSVEDIKDIYYRLEDCAFTIRDYTNRLFFDPARLEAIDERLELLGRLKRKHGGSLELISQRRGEIAKDLQEINSADEEIKKVSNAISLQKLLLQEKAFSLSQKRHEAAVVLKKAIEDEIRSLRMDKANFEVIFNRQEAKNTAAFGPKGIDDVEFYLSPNPGEDLKPLNRIASGGELSRIILAMKNALAKIISIGTMVFDEVDSGIGGATAEVVGKKLRDVSMHHQVLCITHLPQIACFAKRHYRVLKYVSGKRTKASVDSLSDEQRVDEITRMIGGVELTQKAREHAREMLLASRR